MTTSVSDERRRQEIVERTLMGLEEDIEDLRDELLEELTKFEREIGTLAGQLPHWLKLPAGSIKSVFRFSDETVEPSALLGPRAVAIGAGRVESFVHAWLGEGGEPADVELDEDQRAELAEAYTELRDYLQQLADDARATHEAGAETLNEWLDGVLSQLDMRRETDLDAVEQLVHEGEIGRGHKARQEMADLWEEQRLKADELRNAWRPLEAHFELGLEITLDGIRELEELATRARNGLIGANAELADHLEVPAFEDSRDEAREADSDDAAVDASTSATAPIHADPSSVDDISDTEMDATRDDAPEPESHGETEIPEGDGALRVDAPAQDTVPDLGSSGGIVPPDEPQQTELGSLESSSVNDYSEPVIDDVGATRPGHLSADDADSRPSSTVDGSTHTTTVPGAVDGSSSVEEDTDVQPDASDSSRGDSETPVADVSDDGGDPEDEVVLEGKCFRIREGFEPVGWGEIFAAVIVPLGLLVATGVLAGLRITGRTGFDPFESWGWLPAALIVASAWAILVPAALRWRPKWLGWRPRILRLSDVRDERPVEVDADSIRLGDDTWRWGQLRDAELERWDSPPDQMQGWLLRVETPRQGMLELASPEPDREQWKRSTHELVDAPYEAWQLDRRIFEELRDRIID